MNVFTKANHIIQVRNGNLDKASSSYALKKGKTALAKEIIRVKHVRDDEKLKKLQGKKSQLLSDSPKSNATKIRLIDKSIEKTQDKINKRDHRLNQYDLSGVSKIGTASISASRSPSRKPLTSCCASRN